MSDNFKKMLVAIPVKIITVIVAFMIILRLGYVLYDFALNPFHPPATISKETVIHVMTSLIMLELLILTLRFLVEEAIDPNIIIITVMTAVGRDLIILDMEKIDPVKILALGFILAITIIGIFILKNKPD